MKKFLFAAITLCFSLLSVMPTFAEEPEVILHHPDVTVITENDMVKITQIIDEYIATYLNKYNVSKEEDLPGDVAQKMYNEIDELKTEFFNEIPEDELPSQRSDADRRGAVYATADSKTVVYHGHASMSVNSSGTTHIESNPNTTTKFYYDRLRAYWNKHPYSVYKARGKSQATHNYVASRANQYLGIKYNAGNVGGINCASLVKNIWIKEGGLYNNGGITVGSLANHGGLRRVYNYRGGYGAKS